MMYDDEPAAEEPHGSEQDGREPSSHRPVGPALARGWRGHCPNCGGGPILEGYLKVRDHCPSCGEALYHHRADDMPAWATIVLVGHLVGFGFLHVEFAYRPPVWVHWAIWPPSAIGLSVWLLPHIKGAIVALQWAWRMHGFGAGRNGSEDPSD